LKNFQFWKFKNFSASRKPFYFFSVSCWSGDNATDTPYFLSGVKRQKIFLRISLIKKHFYRYPPPPAPLVFGNFAKGWGICNVIPWSGSLYLQIIKNVQIRTTGDILQKNAVNKPHLLIFFLHHKTNVRYKIIIKITFAGGQG